MQIYTKGTARIRHADTGEVYEIEADELDWQAVSGDEGPMGPEVHYEASVEHPDLGTLKWELVEYPVGAEDYRNTEDNGHEVFENFDFGFEHEKDEPEDLDARNDQIEVMINWFLENYEDPAVRTPHESKEGGYQYIFGGPYDAREVLGENFSDVPESWIEQAVNRIESDGIVDWVPIYKGDESSESHDEFDEDGNFDQAPGLQFGFGPDGRITLVQSDPPSSDEFSEIGGLLDGLRQASVRLVSSLFGTNAHTALLDAANSYNAAVHADPISISGAYASGLRLENAGEALRQNADLPPLLTESDEALNTTLQLHGTFIASTRLGRTLLEAAREYARTTADTEEDRARKRQLADAIVGAPEAFDESVRELPVELLRESGAGTFPERSYEAARTTVGNLLKVTGWACSLVLANTVGQGVADSIPSQFLSGSTTVAVDAIWAFVAQHIGLLSELAAAHGPNMQNVRAIFEQVADMLRRQRGK